MSKEQSNLPTLAELHCDPEVAFKNDKLNLLLSQPAHVKWIKTHPKISVKDANGNSTPLQYLPVDKVKYLLTRIFQRWRSEITGVYQLFQSVCVTVRLYYKDPITGEWLSQDGIGSVGVQTDKDASASDLSKIKFDAVMKAAPAAESYAIKNAAEKIGNIFGAGLNKWDIAAFSGSYMPEEEKQEPPPPASGFTAPKPTDFEL